MRIIILLLMVLLLIFPSVRASEITVKSVSYVPCVNGNISCGNVTISFIINGGGQVISGIWSGEGLPDGFKLPYPFQITARNNIEVITFPFLNQGSLKLYNNHFVVAEDEWNGAICELKPKFCFPVNTSRKGLGMDAAFIVDRISSGSYARFGSPTISKSVELVININGTEYKKIMGSGQTSRSSVLFKTEKGERIGTAIWTGYSSTGVNPPNQDNFIATHLPGHGWNITYLTYYEKYVKSLTETDSLLQNYDNDLVPGFDKEGYEWSPEYKYLDMCKDSFCSPILNLVNLHNINYDILTHNNIQIGYGSPTSTLNQNTFVGDGNVIVTSQMPIGYSEITLVMSASQIGVVVSSGKPIIGSITVSNYSIGDGTGSVRVGVQNIGTSSGTFGVRINGSPESRITLGPRSSGSVDLPLNIASEGITESQVEVYDINSGVSTLRSFQVNVTSPKNFIPNESEPYNGVVKKADIYGITEKEDIRCTGGIWQREGSEYKCLDLSTVPEPAVPKKELIVAVPTITPEPPYEGGAGRYLWYLVVFLIGIIFTGFIGSALNSRGGRKNLQGALMVILIVAIISVIILAYVLYLPAIEKMTNELQFINNIYEKLW